MRTRTAMGAPSRRSSTSLTSAASSARTPPAARPRKPRPLFPRARPQARPIAEFHVNPRTSLALLLATGALPALARADGLAADPSPHALYLRAGTVDTAA